jgi:hypothetical protein
MRTKLPKAPVTTKENIATRLIKAGTRLIFPKKVLGLTRTHWVEQMMVSFKGLNLATEQWIEIYNQQAVFFQKGFAKGYSIPLYGMGAILPTKVDKKNIGMEAEETAVPFTKGVLPTLYTNAQLAELN